MDEMWMRYFRKAMEFEEKGYMEEAIALCNKLLEVFADDTVEILIEKAKLEFRWAGMSPYTSWYWRRI